MPTLYQATSNGLRTTGHGPRTPERVKVLFVVPGLDYGGAARQLSLLAARLPRDEFQARVTVLGPAAAWAGALREAGVAVDLLGWSRPFDLRPAWALRRLVRDFRPDVVHAFGPAAARALVLTGSRPPGGLLVSAALPPGRPPSQPDRWLLRRAGGVVAFGEAEAARYRRLGVAEERLAVVRPAVDIPGPVRPAAPPGVPAGARVLLGLGPIEARKGFREAVWAFDMLHHLDPDLHLVLVGAGPDRPRVERFAGFIGATPWVHFPGPVADPAALLARAELVLAPSLQEGGRGAVLEAMAAGRPVVAGRTPALAELVADGETGFLVDPRDKGALGRRALALLDDDALRRRLGAAARRRAAERHAPSQLLDACARLYAALRKPPRNT